jgi:hypothetical protein
VAGEFFTRQKSEGLFQRMDFVHGGSERLQFVARVASVPGFRFVARQLQLRFLRNARSYLLHLAGVQTCVPTDECVLKQC